MPARVPQLGADGSILEGIVTTRNGKGTVNISPMGPLVDLQIKHFVFRPYRTSTTYQNLKREGSGVFHVTDDVMLFAQAALGHPDPLPTLKGLTLTDACRWYAFEIESLDDSQDRTEIVARTVDRGHNRDFFGFNRARHAVIEAAILATRVHLIPAVQIVEDLQRLETPLQKTGSSAELEAFAFLREYIHQHFQRQTRVESQP